MSSLVENYAGKIDLIYIDPPFATGGDFRAEVDVGDEENKISIGKEHTILEEKIYRDTWGSGQSSYLSMMRSRLELMYDLLSPSGSIYIHLDWRMSSSIRLIMDEIFGEDSFQREIIWRMGWVSGYKTMAKNWIRNHDNILFYVKDPSDFVFKVPRCFMWVSHNPNFLR